ncbi:MAG: signal peptide peptidase SppA [Verrucomicrobia bacterium]|jgi:protease IV|nr:signal peptide peptidase SppA [Verrucomicrobiota bacterium]
MGQVTYKPHRRRPGCFVTILILLILAVAVFWLTTSGVLHFSMDRFASEMAEYGEDEFPELDEVWSCGQGSNKVVRIPITGMIMLGESESLFSPGSSAEIALQAIRRATLDETVQAIILDIDSGGGGITASDIIYKALLDFKQADTSRRIVALCGDVAASGAYYVALTADHIIAHPTTITGSIGVLVQSVNFRELAMKHGVKDVTIKSGANKDILNPLSDFTVEQQALMQSVVDALYDRFVELVIKHRNLPEAEVRALADGRIFTSAEALRLGLIDETGYWKDAVMRTAELLDVDAIKVYRYERGFSLGSFLKATQSISPRSWLGVDRETRLQYRWKL